MRTSDGCASQKKKVPGAQAGTEKRVPTDACIPDGMASIP